MTWVLKPCASTLPGPVVCSVNVFAVARTNPRWKLWWNASSNLKPNEKHTKDEKYWEIQSSTWNMPKVMPSGLPWRQVPLKKWYPVATAFQIPHCTLKPFCEAFTKLWRFFSIASSQQNVIPIMRPLWKECGIYLYHFMYSLNIGPFSKRSSRHSQSHACSGPERHWLDKLWGKAKSIKSRRLDLERSGSRSSAATFISTAEPGSDPARHIQQWRPSSCPGLIEVFKTAPEAFRTPNAKIEKVRSFFANVKAKIQVIQVLTSTAKCGAFPACQWLQFHHTICELRLGHEAAAT